MTDTRPGPDSSAPGGQPGALMDVEIREQPDALARLRADGWAEASEVAEVVRRADPRAVVLAARGTSDHAALYAKYLIEINLGLPVGLTSLSTLTVYGARPRFDRVLWLAVSQSGGSPDLVDATRVAADHGALTLAVTNNPGSPLAAAAAHHLDVRAGSERAVAATKSYTNELLMLWMLVDAWRGGDGAAAAGLAELAAQVVTDDGVLDVADRYRFVDKIITTGRGYSYPTAREAALKLMETSYTAAHAFSGADLLHGPLAMVDQDHPVVAVVPEGAGGAAMRDVLERLDGRRADVCLVGDPSAARAGHQVVPLPSGVGEELAPVLQIIPLQRLAHAIAVARHLDPDAPRGLSKVTRTW